MPNFFCQISVGNIFSNIFKYQAKQIKIPKVDLDPSITNKKIEIWFMLLIPMKIVEYWPEKLMRYFTVCPK